MLPAVRTVKRHSAAILLIGILAIYLLFPTKNYYWDGIDFASDIESSSLLAPSLLHANHLLYSPFGQLVYTAVRGAGIKARAVTVLQVTNSLLSVLCALLLFLILNSVTRSRYLSLCLTALFSLSATWWKFSTDVDSYIPATLFLVAALFFLLPGREPRPLAVAALHTCAMLFHQSAVFFFPAAVVGLIFQNSTLPPRRRVSYALWYAVPAFLLTISIFYFCFYTQAGTAAPLRFLSWVSSYSAGSGGFTFDVLSNLTFTLRGHVRLFFGGRITLLRGLLTPVLIALLILLVILVIALCVLLVRSFIEKRPANRPASEVDQLRRVEIICLTWIAPHLVFMFFFYPQDTFHRLVYFPPIILLCGTVLARMEARRTRPRTGRLALAVAALGLANFCFYIYPFTHQSNYPPLDVARRLESVLEPGAVVLFATSTGDSRLAEYFNPSAVWKKLDARTLEAIDSEVREAATGGRGVWLETSAVGRVRSLPGGEEWLSERSAPLKRVELVNDKHDLRFYQVR